MTTDTDLNIEIARLCGWKKCDGEGWYLGSIDGDQPDDDFTDSLPDYATDPAAALGLLDYTLRQKLYGEYPLSVREIWHGLETTAWSVTIEAMHRNAFVPEVMTGTGDDWTGEGETLPLALARCCRDTLAAVREGEERP